MTSDSKSASNPAGDRRSAPDAIPAQLIYESTSDAMWVMRVEPNDRFVITSINPAYTALTGIAPEAMIGRTPADLLHGDDLTHVLERHREAVRQRRPLQYEESIVVGRPIVVETTLTPVFDAAGRCSHILGCTRDIGERKASELATASLQAQLRESRRSNVIGSLASGIANEFANMFEVIQSHLEIARRDARRSAKVLKSLAATSKACKHASEVTKQILAFSTASNATRHTTELPHIVREAVQLARATLGDRHALRCGDSGTTPPVSVDRPQFQQAIISLLLVASRSIGKGDGEVHVHVDAVAVTGAEFASLGSASGTTFARIGIEAKTSVMAADDVRPGPVSAGIDHAAIDATDADVEFPRRIIAAHQGATIVNVGPGGLLSIAIYLPIASTRHGEARVDGNGLRREVSGGLSRGRAKGRTIMYVDDHKWLLPLAERLLADSGFEVRGFVDPQAALDALHERADDFGLIATDYKMSKITGLDIARAAKAARPDLPVVIISAYVTEALKLQALRAGADAVIHKSSLTTELVPTASRLMPLPPAVAAAP